MKKLMKKTMVVLLTVATLIGCMALSVSAAEQRSSKTYTLNQPEFGVSLMTYLHYYYDSSNPNKITKACAVTDFAAGANASILTDEAEQVYVYTVLTINFTNGTSIKRYSRSEPFSLTSTGGVHVGDPNMMSYPYVPSNNASIESIVSQHGVCTYSSYLHEYYNDECDDSEFNVAYPMSGETVLYCSSLAYAAQ